jgi:uncharacterized small protein (DUF1192 family)
VEELQQEIAHKQSQIVTLQAKLNEAEKAKQSAD